MRTIAIRVGALLLLGLYLLSAGPQCAFACSCVPPEAPEQELERAATVFEGQVLQMQIRHESLPLISSADPKFVLFKVSKVWKGQPQGTIVVQTASESPSCGYGFQQGQEYIVYANESQGKLMVSLCSRTRLVADAAEDLAVLGAGQVPPAEQASTSEPSVAIPVETTPAPSDRTLMLAAAVIAGALLVLGLVFGLSALKRSR